MSHYLVTGVAGFIASKVAEFLLDDGHTVVGVDNFSDAYDVRLKKWRLAQIAERPNFDFHELDITRREKVRALFEGSVAFDAVINLAAWAGVRRSVENPWIYLDTNATGTLNLLDLCREHGVEKFVLASTSSLYGKDNPMPYREDQDTSRPLSPYAASKKGGGGAVLHIPLPPRHRRDRLPLLHGLRAGGPPGYEPLLLHAVDRRGASGDHLRRRDAEARLRLRGRHRPRHHRWAAAAGLRDHQPGLRYAGGVDGHGAPHPGAERQGGEVGRNTCRATLPMSTRRGPTSARPRSCLAGPQTSYKESIAALVEWYVENRDWARDVAT